MTHKRSKSNGLALMQFHVIRKYNNFFFIILIKVVLDILFNIYRIFNFLLNMAFISSESKLE